MAKVANNILIEGLTGSLGDKIVLRRGRRGQTIVSLKPVFGPNRQFSAAQKAHQQAFREATAYARSVKAEEFYRLRAQQTDQSSYNVAVADWFHKPQIMELDVTGWDGRAGQTIRIKAVDDVQVTQVSIAITDGNGTVFEQGNAEQDGTSWWTYITKVPTNGTRRLEVTALDRPGNTAQTAWQNN